MYTQLCDFSTFTPKEDDVHEALLAKLIDFANLWNLPSSLIAIDYINKKIVASSYVLTWDSDEETISFGKYQSGSNLLIAPMAEALTILRSKWDVGSYHSKTFNHLVDAVLENDVKGDDILILDLFPNIGKQCITLELESKTVEIAMHDE